MLLICTVPTDVNLPVHPTIMHLIGAHKKREGNIRQENPASQAGVHVCHLNLAHRISLETAPLSLSNLAGGRSRS